VDKVGKMKVGIVIGDYLQHIENVLILDNIIVLTVNYFVVAKKGT